MTYQEIRKELIIDFPIAFKKSDYVIEEVEKKMRKFKLKTHLHVYDYLSRNKNKWIIKVDVREKDVVRFFMTYFYTTENKIAAVGVIDGKQLLYFTSHFFKRYNERLKLNLVVPEDIIRHYVKNSSAGLTVDYLGVVKENIVKVFISVKQGIILGNLHYDIQFCKMNTFITHEMLKEDQIERKNQMEEFLNKYRIDSGKLD